jgi:RNA polymerase sigma-70 factor (ECF subfamily)
VEAKSRHHEESQQDPLAARLADGDPRAPRELVERHQTELYRYAFAMLGERGAAEDAVQTAFERALAAMGRYPEERLRGMRLRAWLYRVTLNVLRNALRLNRRETPEDPGKLSELAGVASGERREETMDVLAALGRLPERQRTAIVLRYLQDLPYAEIAAATGWPEATARTLVRMGLGRLRGLIEIETEKGGGVA